MIWLSALVKLVKRMPRLHFQWMNVFASHGLQAFFHICLPSFRCKQNRHQRIQSQKIGKEVAQRRTYSYIRKTTQPAVMFRKISPNLWFPPPWDPLEPTPKRNLVVKWTPQLQPSQAFLFPKKLDPRTREAWRPKTQKTSKNKFFRIIAQCKMMEVDSENVRASHLQAPLLVAGCACGVSPTCIFNICQSQGNKSPEMPVSPRSCTTHNNTWQSLRQILDL